MTSINEKLGLKRAGKRKMMKDAGKNAASAERTSRICPRCPHRWVIEHEIHGVRQRLCAWCGWQEAV